MKVHQLKISSSKRLTNEISYQRLLISFDMLQSADTMFLGFHSLDFRFAIDLGKVSANLVEHVIHLRCPC